MRVFVTGAGGYLGSAIVRAFVEAGHEVTGMHHSPESGDGVRRAGARPLRGDVTVPGPWAEAAGEHEVVVHAAFDYGDPAQADLSAIDMLVSAALDATGNRHLIYTSGCWVLGDTGDEPADEESPVDHPAEVVAWRPAHEEQVLGSEDETLRASVVRPGMVYGGRGGVVGSLFQSAAEDGAARVVGDGGNRWSLIHRDDLGRLYVRIAEERKSGVFHGVDGTPLPVRDVARAASEAAGANGEVRTLPVEEAREEMGPMADALMLDQALVSARAEEVGWSPRHGSFVESADEAWREWRDGAEGA